MRVPGKILPSANSTSAPTRPRGSWASKCRRNAGSDPGEGYLDCENEVTDGGCPKENRPAQASCWRWVGTIITIIKVKALQAQKLTREK